MMKITELRVGMPITLSCLRRYDYNTRARIEAIGYDWLVVRFEADVPAHDPILIAAGYFDDIKCEGWDGAEEG